MKPHEIFLLVNWVSFGFTTVILALYAWNKKRLTWERRGMVLGTALAMGAISILASFGTVILALCGK